MKMGWIGAGLLVMLLIGLVGFGSAIVCDQEITVHKQIVPLGTDFECDDPTGIKTIEYAIVINAQPKERDVASVASVIATFGDTNDANDIKFYWDEPCPEGDGAAVGFTLGAEPNWNWNAETRTLVLTFESGSSPQAGHIVDYVNDLDLPIKASLVGAGDIVTPIRVRYDLSCNEETEYYTNDALDVRLIDKFPNKECKLTPDTIVYRHALGDPDGEILTEDETQLNYYKLSGDVLKIFIANIEGSEYCDGTPKEVTPVPDASDPVITDQFPALVTFSIDVPCDIAPDTLYNSVMLESDNDEKRSNNYAVRGATLSVPYDQRFAFESFEDLLKSQNELLGSFEDLVKQEGLVCKEASVIATFEDTNDANDIKFYWDGPCIEGDGAAVGFTLGAEPNWNWNAETRTLVLTFESGSSPQAGHIVDYVNDLDLPIKASLVGAGDIVTPIRVRYDLSCDCSSEFVASFENLLRTQTKLYASFEELLYNDDNTGWNDNLDTRRERAVFLKSYEDLLRKQSFLFLSFESILKTDDFFSNLPGYEQERLLASFEDLLKRQVKLYKSFEKLEKKLDAGIVSVPDDLTDPEWQAARVSFLSSFEDLLRLEANLLGSFEDLLKDPSKIWDLQDHPEDARWEASHTVDEFSPYPYPPVGEVVGGSKYCLYDKDCDDGNECTNDQCEYHFPALWATCQHYDATWACDDFNLCTIGDKCEGGQCVSGAPVVCEEGKECNPQTGYCVATET